MGKNVIQHKNVKVHEQLYNEILNGFQNSGSFSKKEKINSIQKIRIRNVGQVWADNERSYKFLEDVKRMIIPIKKDISQQWVFSFLQYGRDFDEIDEESGTKTNDGLWKVLSLVHNAHKSWEKINRIYKVVKITSKVVNSYKNTNRNQKEKMKTNFVALIVGTLGDSLDKIFTSATISATASLLKTFESPKVKNLFINLKEKQKEIEKYVAAKLAATVFDRIPIVGGWAGPLVDTVHQGGKVWEDVKKGNWEKAISHSGRALASGGLLVLGVLDKTKVGGKVVGKVIQRTVKFSQYARRAANAALWANRGVDVASIAEELNDIIDWDEEDRQELRSWIETDITESLLKPTEQEIQRNVHRLHDLYLNGVQNVVLQFEAQANDILGVANGLQPQKSDNTLLEDIRNNETLSSIIISNESLEQNLHSSHGVLPEVDRAMISWKQDDLSTLMRTSFRNRYNIEIEGNIPQVQTKESMSIKTLSASFAYIYNFIKKSFQVISTELEKLPTKEQLMNKIYIQTQRWEITDNVNQIIERTLEHKGIEYGYKINSYSENWQKYKVLKMNTSGKLCEIEIIKNNVENAEDEIWNLVERNGSNDFNKKMESMTFEEQITESSKARGIGSLTKSIRTILGHVSIRFARRSEKPKSTRTVWGYATRRWVRRSEKPKSTQPWQVGFFPNGAIKEVVLDYMIEKKFDVTSHDVVDNNIPDTFRYIDVFEDPIDITKQYISKKSSNIDDYHVFVLGNYNNYYNFMSKIMTDKSQGEMTVYKNGERKTIEIIGLVGLDSIELEEEVKINQNVEKLLEEYHKVIKTNRHQ